MKIAVALAAFASTSLVAAVLLAQPCRAQDDQPNVAVEAAAEASSPLKLARLSRELAAAGRATGDAMLLVTAARLQKQIEARAVDRTAEADGGDGDADDQTEQAGWEQMLEEAVKLAPDDDVVAELAEDVRAMTTKGRTIGPAYSYGTVRANGKNAYRNIPFEGGKYAEVYAEGSGRSNLDLFVTDEKGHIVCSDTDASDINYCGWTPRFEGRFSVTVQNRGPAANRYRFMTN